MKARGCPVALKYKRRAGLAKEQQHQPASAMPKYMQTSRGSVLLFAASSLHCSVDLHLLQNSSQWDHLLHNWHHKVPTAPVLISCIVQNEWPAYQCQSQKENDTNAGAPSPRSLSFQLGAIAMSCFLIETWHALVRPEFSPSWSSALCTCLHHQTRPIDPALLHCPWHSNDGQ